MPGSEQVFAADNAALNTFEQTVDDVMLRLGVCRKALASGSRRQEGIAYLAKEATTEEKPKGNRKQLRYVSGRFICFGMLP